MATSTAIQQYHGNSKLGEYEELRMVYDAHGATDDGVWLSAAGIQSIMVLVDGSSPVGTTTLGGSNGTDSSFTIPANTADGTSLGTVTNAGTLSLEAHQIPRYIKPHLSAFTSGTFNVTLKIRRSANG